MAARLLRRIADDQRGSMAIETAIVAPTLILMTLGIFEIGTMVARQHELQSAANESEIIAIAINSGAGNTDTDQVKAILRESLDLGDDDVVISLSYRCGTDTALVTDPESCDEDDVVANYIDIDIVDTHEPVWTAFGIGRPITFSVERTVQVS